MQVRHVDQRVLGQVIVLLCEKNALLEQVLADLISVLLGDDHGWLVGRIDDGPDGIVFRMKNRIEERRRRSGV